MRKTLWIIPSLLLFAAIGAPPAHADTMYAISFSAGGPTVVGSDLLDYNTSTMEFTTPSIEILFEGADFVLTALAGQVVDPTTDTIAWRSYGFTPTFDICISTNSTMTGTCPQLYVGSAPGLGHIGGTVTLTAQTPEPATGGLMLLAIGFVLAMRKRIALGLPQAI